MTEEIILQHLALHPKGVRLAALAAEVGLTYYGTRKILRVLRAREFVDTFDHGLWGTTKNIARVREIAKLRREIARRKEKRAALAAAGPPAPRGRKAYHKPADYEVKDLPVVQRRVDLWVPPAGAPGARSVFEWGAYARV